MTPGVLTDRRVLITGGSKGIGLAIAKQLVLEGAIVALCARGREALDQAKEMLDAEIRGRTHCIVCDLTDSDAVFRSVEGARDRMGGLDGLVNNAGSNQPTRLFLDISRQDFSASIALNLIAHTDVVRAVLPHMLQQSRGAIVNIASMAGKMGVPGWSPYCTAKHAIVGFTKCIAREYALEGIRCNAVCPGFVDTEMMSAEHLDGWAETLGMTRRALVKEVIYKTAPQARFVDARSVATATAFLLSDQAVDITGQTLNVSAGIGDY